MTPNLPLVRIVKDWKWPELLRQTPNGKGIWNGIQFTLDPVEECDYLIVLNNRKHATTHARCPEENVWAIMQEPYMKYLYDWMIEGHESFSKVFTHYPLLDNPKYIASQPAIPWHINRTFDQLIQEPVPEKSKNISWITSKLTFLPGHRKKMALLNFLKQNASLEIDLYGRGIRYIKDKWDGLAPYKYSIAIENSSGPDYWTEKIADCFLTWTVPIYYGCTNLEEYFPKESFIRIDIDQPKACLEEIREIISLNDWENRITALKKSRDLVLYRYQFFPYVVARMKSFGSADAEKTDVLIPGYSSKKLINVSKYLVDRISHGDFAGLFSLLLNKYRYMSWERKKEFVV